VAELGYSRTTIREIARVADTATAPRRDYHDTVEAVKLIVAGSLFDGA
jgi:hypothetical protein